MDNKPFDFVAYVDKLNYKDAEINPQSTIITRDLNPVREPYIINNSTEWNFTHDYILRWLKGKCKEVVLVGTADFETDKHYNRDDPFKPCRTNVDNSIKFIESITDFKVYKANPNGKLNIEHKDITMLYKKKKVLK